MNLEPRLPAQAVSSINHGQSLCRLFAIVSCLASGSLHKDDLFGNCPVAVRERFGNAWLKSILYEFFD